MPNYQPNYIYSPRYGSRYMGNNIPAPATGGIGQSDPLSAPVNYEAGVNTASKQGSVNTGAQGPNGALGAPPVMSMDGSAVGWTSSTGRDTSAISNLGDFGFRGLAAEDPFNEDYFKSPTTPYTAPSPITSSPIPQATTDSGSSSSSYTAPSGDRFDWGSGGGLFGTAEDPFGTGTTYGGYSHNLDGGQGVDLSGQSLALIGQQYPWFLPGGLVVDALTGAYLDNQLDAMGQVDDALKAGPTAGAGTADNFYGEQLVQISDKDGNVRTVTQSQADALGDLAANTETSTGIFGTSGSIPEGSFSSDAFGNADEATAVAKFGLGSDPHFDAIQRQYDMMGATGSTRATDLGNARATFDKAIADMDLSNMTADQMEEAINGSDIAARTAAQMTPEARMQMEDMKAEWEMQDAIEYDQAVQDYSAMGISTAGMDRKTLQANQPAAEAAYSKAQKYGVNFGTNTDLATAQAAVEAAEKAYKTNLAIYKRYGVSAPSPAKLANMSSSSATQKAAAISAERNRQAALAAASSYSSGSSSGGSNWSTGSDGRSYGTSYSGTSSGSHSLGSGGGNTASGYTTGGWDTGGLVTPLGNPKKSEEAAQYEAEMDGQAPQTGGK